MASPKDAEYGWVLYRDSGFTLTKAELDELLADAGLAPSSDRMFRHYRKLERYGHEGYLPINQLDVRTLADPIWERAARAGYPAYVAHEPVTVVMVDRTSELTLRGIAVAVSDGEVSVRLTDPTESDLDYVQSFQRKSSRVSQLLFEDTGEIRLTELMSVTTRSQPEMTVLRFSFRDIESIGAILPEREAVRPEELVLRIGAAGTRLMGVTAQQLVASFQLVDSSRVVAAEVLRDLDRDGVWRFDPPEIRQMSAGSPLDIAIVVAGGIGSIVSISLLWAKGYYEVHKSRLAAKKAELDVEVARYEVERTKDAARAQQSIAAQEDIRAQMLRIELEWQRRRMSQHTVEELEQSVVEAVAADIDEDASAAALDEPTRETVRNLLQRQIGPAAQRLVEHADGEVTFMDEATKPAN